MDAIRLLTREVIIVLTGLGYIKITWKLSRWVQYFLLYLDQLVDLFLASKEDAAHACVDDWVIDRDLSWCWLNWWEELLMEIALTLKVWTIFQLLMGWTHCVIQWCGHLLLWFSLGRESLPWGFLLLGISCHLLSSSSWWTWMYSLVLVYMFIKLSITSTLTPAYWIIHLILPFQQMVWLFIDHCSCSVNLTLILGIPGCLSLVITNNIGLLLWGTCSDWPMVGCILL